MHTLPQHANCLTAYLTMRLQCQPTATTLVASQCWSHCAFHYITPRPRFQTVIDWHRLITNNSTFGIPFAKGVIATLLPPCLTHIMGVVFEEACARGKKEFALWSKQFFHCSYRMRAALRLVCRHGDLNTAIWLCDTFKLKPHSAFCVLDSVKAEGATHDHVYRWLEGYRRARPELSV
jgi:hypothetical protein